MKADAEPRTPEELRPYLHGRIDTLDHRELAMVHRILLQLEADRLVAELRTDFSSEKQLAQRVDKAVAEFRKEHPYR
jgi:hypothetical protein